MEEMMDIQGGHDLDNTERRYVQDCHNAYISWTRVRKKTILKDLKEMLSEDTKMLGLLSKSNLILEATRQFHNNSVVVPWWRRFFGLTGV